MVQPRRVHGRDRWRQSALTVVRNPATAGGATAWNPLILEVFSLCSLSNECSLHLLVVSASPSASSHAVRRICGSFGVSAVPIRAKTQSGDLAPLTYSHLGFCVSDLVSGSLREDAAPGDQNADETNAGDSSGQQWQQQHTETF